MPEIVENGHARWDAGAGTTALGIIGTTLGGLATAMAGGNALTGTRVATPFENQGVCQHDMDLMEKLNDAKAKIASLEAQKYSDASDLKLYEHFDKKISELKETMNARFSAQEVINANVNAAINVIKSQVAVSAAVLSSITKTAVPKSVICDFNAGCGTCQTSVL